MAGRTVIKSAFKYIDEISTREFRVAVFVCVTIAALNALIVSYIIGYSDGHAARVNTCYVPMHRDFFHDFMRLKIGLALVVIAVGFL